MLKKKGTNFIKNTIMKHQLFAIKTIIQYVMCFGSYSSMI